MDALASDALASTEHIFVGHETCKVKVSCLQPFPFSKKGSCQVCAGYEAASAFFFQFPGHACLLLGFAAAIYSILLYSTLLYSTLLPPAAALLYVLLK